MENNSTPSTPGKMQVRMYLKAAVFSLAAVLFFYYLFDWTMSAFIHQRKEVTVPDLRSKSLSDAVSMVSFFNMGLKKDGEEFDENLPAGTVIRQNPVPGTTVREGKIVRIIISQGGEVVFIPNLVDQPLRAAEVSIRSSGLSLGEESTKYSMVVEKGNVLAQDPPAGKIVEKDTIINMVVSAGVPPEDVKLMPDLIGKNISDAKAWFDKSGFVFAVNEEKSKDMAPGTVIRQDPQPDTDLSAGTTVVFVIAGADSELVYQGRTFYYEIPQGGTIIQLRMTMIDEKGEKEIFRGTRQPGTKLDIPISPAGQARIRIYINSILVEEKEIQ